ncbi:hypothetical protein IG631_22148 [Alternaria alternata]|nr:hypothetical protein IG631_22148 [Alternaria alternata]
MIGHICGIPVGEYGPILNWEVNDDTSTPRREGYPTWSWLSRKGSITFLYSTPLASICVQTRRDVDLDATPEWETVPSEGPWVSIAEYSIRSDLRIQPSGAGDDPNLIRISG